MARTIKDVLMAATGLDQWGVTRLRKVLELVAKNHPTLKVETIVLQGFEIDPATQIDRRIDIPVTCWQRPGRRR